MKYLLIGGAKSVGKTTALWDVYDYLRSIHFIHIDPNFVMPSTPVDFKVVLEGKDKFGKTIYILLNTPTDENIFIDYLDTFRKAQKVKIDIIISSVRDVDPERAYFFSKMAINPTVDIVVEVPLAKVTNINTRGASMRWFQTSINNLIKHTLSNQPFDI